MAKKYYSDYCEHCARFYANNQHLSTFDSETDKRNHTAVHKTVSVYPEIMKTIILTVYQQKKSTINDAVAHTAKKFGEKDTIIWAMICRFEKHLAQNLKLI